MFRSSTVAEITTVEVSEMVTTVVLAGISSPGWMVRPITVPSMGALALQLARFSSAVFSYSRAVSRFCWMVNIWLSLSSPSMRTSTWPGVTCR